MRLALLLLVALGGVACAPAGPRPKFPLTPAAQPRLMAQTAGGSVDAVAFVPGRDWVLTADASVAILWDVPTGRILRELRGSDGPGYRLASMVVTADGRRALIGGADGSVRVWDLESGQTPGDLPGHKSPVISLAVTADGRRVVTGSDDGTARVWDLQTRQLLWKLEDEDPVMSVAVTADGKQAVIGSDGAPRVWDLETGQTIRKLTGQAMDWGRLLAVTGDGKRALAVNPDRTASVWDLETSETLWELKGHVTGAFTGSWVVSGAVTADGKQVVTGGTDWKARVWDLETGRPRGELKGHTGAVVSVAVTADGKRVVTGSDDGTARLWDLQTCQFLRELKGYTDMVYDVAVTADGKRVLAVNPADSVRVWDVETGRTLRELKVHRDRVRAVAVTQDGKRALTGSEDGTVRVWDLETSRTLWKRKGHSEAAYAVAVTGDGKRAFTGSGDGTARVWDLKTGGTLRKLKTNTSWGVSVAVTADGKRAVTGFIDDPALVWDLENKRILLTQKEDSYSVAVTADGKRALMGGADGTARVWDLEADRIVWRLEGHAREVEVAATADGKRGVTRDGEGRVRLWDLRTGQPLRELRGTAAAVALTADGKRAVTAHSDGTKLWNLDTGKELCTLLTFTDGTWAVTDPDGRYDGSNRDGIQGLHWVLGNEPVELRQFALGYYTPGLLGKIHRGEALRPVPKLADLRLYPKIEVIQPAPGSRRLTIRLTDEGGGIGPVAIFVNKSQVIEDARTPALRAAPRGNHTLTVDLPEAHLLPGRTNDIEVLARNADGSLQSRPKGVRLVAEGTDDEPDSRLFAVLCGTSDYAGEALDLRFADKDARDLARALQRGGRRLFKELSIRLLSTDLTPVDGIQPVAPTRANVRAAIEATLAKGQAGPDDVLLLYFSGHGTAFQDRYAYLCADASSTNVAGTPYLNEWCVTGEDLAEWLGRPRSPQKKILILDTCAAGQAQRNLAELMRADVDQTLAAERLKDTRGVHILMGCAADRVSYETSQFGQGLLTYAVLQGLAGAALGDGGVADVALVMQYAKKRVEELTRQIGLGLQQPHVIAGQGGSFPFARMEADDKKAVEPRPSLPLLLRPRLVAENDDAATLDLSDAVRVELVRRQMVAAARRGGSGPRTWLSEGEGLPSALRPDGNYAVQGGELVVKLRLMRGSEVAVRTVEIRVPLVGGAGGLAAAAARVAERIEALAVQVTPRLPKS